MSARDYADKAITGGADSSFRRKEPIPEADNQQALVEELVDALEAVLDPDPCWLDHNGNCQAHFVSNPCEVAAARALIARVRGAS